MCNIDLRLISVIVAIINTVENKRYDIEEQCRHEFGMDLDSVLRQFRRSDDYVKILKMRTKEFHTFFLDVIYQSFDWNINKLKEQIQAEFGLNNTTPAPVTTTTPRTPVPTPTTKYPETVVPGPEYEEERDNETANINKAHMLRSRISGRRQDGHTEMDKGTSMAKVKNIDLYPKLSSYLTVSERNHFKDIGYFYVGEIMHGVIQAFGGTLLEDSTRGSTRLTSPGETTAKPHVLRHIVNHKNSGREGPTGLRAIAPRNKITKRYLLVSKVYPSHIYH